MLLKDYFPNIGKKYEKTFFSDICFDSSKVKKDNIFFAIKGTNIDGNNFILDAINKGSKIIVTEKKITKFPNGVLIIHSKNVRKLLAEVSFKIYNKKPSNLIAITGTNGKSSVADFYYQILKFNKRKVASIGTLGVKSNNKYINLSNTTIDPIQLGKILNYLKNQKVDDVILEASSHGLSQNRLDGLKFNSGIFTNLSQDHLDYHKNLKDYLIAKLYLFEKLLSIKGNVITDEKIPEFRNIKKIALKRNLKIFSINNPKNHFKILSHYFVGEKQMLIIKYKNLISDIPEDYTKISLTYFFLLLIFTILTLLSFNIYNKFNYQFSFKEVEKDQVYNDVYRISNQYDLYELSHDDFINNLIPLNRANYSQNLSIFAKPNKTIFYKIQNNIKNTLQFGEITKSNELILDLDNDFFIDLSNINNIDKIIYRGVEIRLNKELNSYLFNFHIKDLETLL